jgi:hypothetical protein
MTLATAIVPGLRKSNTVTMPGAFAANVSNIPEGPGTMDAATIAGRQREAGGAPSERRSRRERSRSRGPGGLLHQFVTATRALFASGLRTDDV